MDCKEIEKTMGNKERKKENDLIAPRLELGTFSAHNVRLT